MLVSHKGLQCKYVILYSTDEEKNLDKSSDSGDDEHVQQVGGISLSMWSLGEVGSV